VPPVGPAGPDTFPGLPWSGRAQKERLAAAAPGSGTGARAEAQPERAPGCLRHARTRTATAAPLRPGQPCRGPLRATPAEGSAGRMRNRSGSCGSGSDHSAGYPAGTRRGHARTKHRQVEEGHPSGCFSRSAACAASPATGSSDCSRTPAGHARTDNCRRCGQTTRSPAGSPRQASGA
jgi:hypothetical protein